MTKQKAIGILERYLLQATYAEDYFISRDDEEYELHYKEDLKSIEEEIEALNMAIRALKKET